MVDPLAPHSHEPNPDPPSLQADFSLHLPPDRLLHLHVNDLQALPGTEVDDCLIVSTGHGTSGPFLFRGVLLRDLLRAYACAIDEIASVEVRSDDGFGTCVQGTELALSGRAGSILLAYSRDGQPLTRYQGLVRLIVPSETDDALRQVKWVSDITVREKG